jgi:putative transposase
VTKPAFVSVTPGSLVASSGRMFRITHLLGIDNVLAEDLATGMPERLRIDDLGPAATGAPADGTEPTVATAPDLEAIGEAEWAVAQRRLAAIKPLLDDPFRTRATAEAAASAHGVNTATIYEWMRLYTGSGHLSALIPRPRGRKLGTKRVSAEVEAVIASAIKDEYLSKQKKKPQQVVKAVMSRCKTAGIEPPHHNTVRKRIRGLPVAATLRRRGQRDVARNRHEPVRGSFPGADFPLAVVQIDHTLADIILVDERSRQPMGRPWVTLALDVFSRMVVGFYVSMERPNAFAAGGCLSQAMLPKRGVLARLEVPGDWPVWGKMSKVHADNAREFKGEVLKRACAQYEIDLELRPLKQPHYGGHIERLMGTAANEIRNLPGATFSSPAARKGYDSEREAAMTLDEFEAYLLDFIVNVYHKRFHHGLGTPPLRRWEAGILGDGDEKGTGLPDVPGDPERIRLDFLPFEERTVQPYGIVIDGVHYWDEVLASWINASDPEEPRRKRNFIVRRDPRLISPIFFWDPQVERYFDIPYRDTTRRPLSLWELRAARQLLADEGKEHIDEVALFEAAERLNRRIENAKAATKSVRRQAHRQEQTRRASARVGQVPASAGGDAPLRLADPLNELFAKPVERFGHIDVKPGGGKPPPR